MASLLSDIIRAAYRETNLIAKVSDPDENEMVEGLDRLNVILASLMGSEIGLGLNDLAIGGDLDRSSSVTEFLPEDVRLVLNLSASQSFKLHPQPRDGARLTIVDGLATVGTYTVALDGNGRLVEGAANLDILTSDDLGQWMYRADLANWVRLAELGEGDDMPFPGEFDDYFVVKLAMRLNPRHGAPLAQESQAALQDAQQRLQARYRKPRPAQELGTLGLMGSTYSSGSSISPSLLR